MKPPCCGAARVVRPRSGGHFPPLHTLFSERARASPDAAYTRIVGLVWLRLIAILVVLVIACGSQPRIAGRFARAFGYVVDTSDSIALGFADTIREGGTSLFCLSCLGSEARAVVRAAEDDLSSTSAYQRMEQHVTSPAEKAPCEQIPSRTSSGSVKTAATKDATPAADRSCR